MLIYAIARKIDRFLCLIINSLYIVSSYFIDFFKPIFYYAFLIFLYDLYIYLFFQGVSFIETYITENNLIFFNWLEKASNRIKLLLYGTSDVYPPLTGYDAFILLVDAIFYLFNIPLIIYMKQFPESFF